MRESSDDRMLRYVCVCVCVCATAAMLAIVVISRTAASLVPGA